MINITRRLPLCWFGKKTIIDSQWRDSLKQRGIAADLGWDLVVGDKLMSQSPTIRSYRISVPAISENGPAEIVYFKRQIIKKKLKSLKRFWLRPSKSAVEAWSYHRLNTIGINCPELIAIGEERRFGALLTTFLVTREVPNSQDMLTFAKEYWYPLPAMEKKQILQQIMDQLAKQLRLAHDNDFFHHDIKWRNILIQKNENDYKVFWIDSPRASGMMFRKKRGVMVDLSCLARVALSMLSPYDRIRFLMKYLGKSRKKGDIKRLVKVVDEHLSRRPPLV